MKIMFVGLGSIGQRHLQNAKKIFKRAKFFAYRVKKTKNVIINTKLIKKDNFRNYYKINEIYNFHDAKKIKPDITFICNPSSLHLDTAIKFGQKFTQEKKSMQASLFSDSNSAIILEPKLSNLDEWSKRDSLRKEKEMIGFYLSGNPLDDYLNDLNELNNIKLLNLPEKLPETIKIGGIIQNINNLYDKKNMPWAIIELYDGTGKADVFIFIEIYVNRGIIFNKL